MRAHKPGESALLLIDVVEVLTREASHYAHRRGSMDAARAIQAAGASLDLNLLRRLAAGFGTDAVTALQRLLPG